MRRSGGLRERRLLVDAERIVQSRRDAVLDDRPPDRAQVVAHAAVERRLMCLHFFAHAARDGILVALAARVVIEQGAEPRRRGELGLKHAATPLEQSALRSEEHTSELQSRLHLVCRLLLEKKKLPPLYSLDSLRRAHSTH